MLYNIETGVHDKVITQEVEVTYDGIVFNFYKVVVDTKEKQMREALISLGWTPPDE